MPALRPLSPPSAACWLLVPVLAPALLLPSGDWTEGEMERERRRKEEREDGGPPKSSPAG